MPEFMQIISTLLWFSLLVCLILFAALGAMDIMSKPRAASEEVRQRQGDEEQH